MDFLKFTDDGLTVIWFCFCQRFNLLRIQLFVTIAQFAEFLNVLNY